MTLVRLCIASLTLVKRDVIIIAKGGVSGVFSRFCIVQLTDLHITKMPCELFYGIDTRAYFEHVLCDAIAKEAPHHVLLTGDIAAYGDVEAYRWVMTVMKPLECTWSWLPGNHDQPRVMKNNFMRCIDYGNWTLVCLNSRQSGCNDGFFSEEALEWLEACLVQKTHRFVMVCLHHHVHKIGSTLDESRIKNAHFFRLLHQFPCIKAIVHGHIHQQWIGWTSSGIPILSAPATSVQFLPKATTMTIAPEYKPGYRLLSLYENGTFDTKVRRIMENEAD